jgi:hypothetical protein
MGQYYKVIILADNMEIIRVWITPGAYNCGNKLMEHSYLNNKFMNAMEYLISINGMFYKSRIIWTGDYADAVEPIQENDDGEELNLYLIAEQQYAKYISPYVNEKCIDNMDKYRFIVNHTKKLYVDKQKCEENSYGLCIHPLPLLVSDNCNGRGGGDYFGNNETLCGTWRNDVISVEKSIDTLIDYKELECNFEE